MRFGSFGLTLGFVASATSLTACRGNILSTAKLTGSGTADAHFSTNGAAVALWADTDGSWTSASSLGTSHFPAKYEIDVVSNGTNVGHVTCDTADVSEAICGVSVTEGTKHSGDCELKLRCSLPTLPAGDIVLHVSGSPSKDVIEVKKMSINVRDK